MIEIVPIERLNATDLNMYQCGTEKCKPGHYFGPAVRDYFLFTIFLTVRVYIRWGLIQFK